ncbi:MAG: hypothetical protein JWP63_3065 [Candidatus Solibacter sp.]|nr:hypothetical protein [Candidatus Solibacter sp.]
MKVRLHIFAKISVIPRFAACLLLAVSSYWAAKLAWADHLSRDLQPAIRERAQTLAPVIAAFSERLAERREDLLLNSLPDRWNAAELDTENADRLMQLATRAELAGEYSMAERSLLAAAGRSRLYQPKYLLAQYYFRRRNAGPFWTWARAALESSYGDIMPLLDLCWRERPDAAWLANDVLPPRPALIRQYLTFLIRHEQWEAAFVEARRIAASPHAADQPVLLDYCDARLAKSSAGDSLEIWNALCRPLLLREEPLDPSRSRLVTNGEFLHTASGHGFDWRLTGQNGLRCDTGNGEMRLTFSGHQPERCPIAWQYVPLEPGASYRLRYDVLGTDRDAARCLTWEAPDSGLALQPDGTAIVTARGDLGRIVLLYQRPVGATRLQGSVTITRVRLERMP